MARNPDLELDELKKWFAGLEPLPCAAVSDTTETPASPQNVGTPRSELPRLTSPKARKPLFPKKLSAAQRKGLGEQFGVDSQGAKNNHDSELEQLRVQNERLRLELESLREMYAKHTAYTELKCDRLIREKDQECSDWYKERKLEIKKMQSAGKIMHAIFVKRRNALLAEMEANQSEFVYKESQLHQQVAEMKSLHESETKRLSSELEEHVARHNVELADLHDKKTAADAKASELEQLLEESRRIHDRLKEEHLQQSKELGLAKDKLAQAEKNADLDRRDQQITALETELQNTRDSLKKAWKKEVEQLRRELMDYVRFIVHILPDDWADTDAFNKMPTDLKAQLSWTGRNSKTGRSSKSGRMRSTSRGKMPGGGRASRPHADSQGTVLSSDAVLKEMFSEEAETQSESVPAPQSAPRNTL